jgi:hypothetical protein
MRRTFARLTFARAAVRVPKLSPPAFCTAFFLGRVTYLSYCSCSAAVFPEPSQGLHASRASSPAIILPTTRAAHDCPKRSCAIGRLSLPKRAGSRKHGIFPPPRKCSGRFSSLIRSTTSSAPSAFNPQRLIPTRRILRFLRSARSVPTETRVLLHRLYNHTQSKARLSVRFEAPHAKQSVGQRKLLIDAPKPTPPALVGSGYMCGAAPTRCPNTDFDRSSICSRLGGLAAFIWICEDGHGG